MPLILTLISIILCYFSPAEFYPGLSPYHPQQLVLLPAVASSLMTLNMHRKGVMMPQALLMVGLWCAIVVSLLSKFWLRAALGVFIDSGILVCVYFLVTVNGFTLQRVKWLCAVMSLCGLVLGALAILAFHTGVFSDQFVMSHVEQGFVMSRRVRGIGILHDPNDFAQFEVVSIALLGLNWRRGNLLRGLLLVIFPSLVMLYAIFLAGSRGSIFGLSVMMLVAIAPRIGKIQSLMVVMVLFAAMVGAQFGGGREISIREGSAGNRIVAWGSGIAQLKSRPVFGVGFGQFTEYNELTAHNSFVLCFAELGFFGYFFWLGLIVTTVWGLARLSKLPIKTEADADFARYVLTMRVALYSFLATAWFLSRTYTETLYILLAMAAVLIELRRDIVPSTALPPRKWVPVVIGLEVASILIIYLTVRVRNF